MPTALLSVYNKEGIVDFARQLKDLGWNVMASGGTAKVLRDGGLAVSDVADLVGGGAILGHRVVTLSREINAGLLARPTEDADEMRKLRLTVIDLVCVDLYPLRNAIRAPNATLASVIEMTDIGGPTMLRSAAKGKRIVICDPADRTPVLQWLRDGQPNRDQFVNALAAKAEFTVADYCLASARYRSEGTYDGLIGHKVSDCCYGENRGQSPAALFSTNTNDPLALDRFQLVAGSEPSYINVTDVDRLLQTITHIAAVFDTNNKPVPSIAVGCKHGNACGAGISDYPYQALKRMKQGDPLALFGGFVMTNFPITKTQAEHLLSAEGKPSLDGVIAPGFSAEAPQLLQRNRGKCRLYENPALGELSQQSLNQAPLVRPVRGGWLIQPHYTYLLNLSDTRLQKSAALSPEQENDLLLAWAVGSTSNSNTITLVKGGMLIGNGVGQQDRVGGCELAIRRAQRSGHDIQGAVGCSDSYFPFPDGPELLVKAGVKAILTTSGSVNDQNTRDVCAEHDVTLWMIPDAVGRGFCFH